MVPESVKVYQIYRLAQLQVGHIESYNNDRYNRAHTIIFLRYSWIFCEEDFRSLRDDQKK